MPPSMEIDEIWHAHILDTFAYEEHCDHIFGYYFHHFPYFGTRGAADLQQLASSFNFTKQRYLEEYGVRLTRYIASGPRS